MARAGNAFAFFTVQSNLLVGIATLLLAVRLERSSAVFGVLRLAGLVAITVVHSNAPSRSAIKPSTETLIE